MRFQGILRVDLQGDAIRFTTLVNLFSTGDIDTGGGLVWL
jgi:16S rRNA G1207 methylase RsmC